VKKFVLGAMVICASVLFSHEVFAQVEGEGELSFNFGRSPDSVAYGSSVGYYGYIGDSPYQQQAFLTNGIGSDSYHNNSISAIWGGSGQSSFLFLAQAPAVGANGYASADLSGSFRWNGTFPGFTYHYDYHGTTDSSQDSIEFLTQMEISRNGVYYYSDYDSSVPGFQSKFFEFNTPVPGTLDQSGFVAFDPINETGNWFVKWDFMGSGKDYGTTVTPEPLSSALFLLGSGVLGLAARRKRKAKL